MGSMSYMVYQNLVLSPAPGIVQKHCNFTYRLRVVHAEVYAVGCPAWNMRGYGMHSASCCGRCWVFGVVTRAERPDDAVVMSPSLFSGY